MTPDFCNPEDILIFQKADGNFVAVDTYSEYEKMRTEYPEMFNHPAPMRHARAFKDKDGKYAKAGDLILYFNKA